METYTWQLLLFLGIIEYKCTGTIIGRTWQLGSGGHIKDILCESRSTKNNIQGDLKKEVTNVTASARDIISSGKQISLKKFRHRRHLQRRKHSQKDHRGTSQLNISSDSLNPHLEPEMSYNLQNESKNSASRLIDENSPSIELMSYSFSSNESENSESKTTILEKLELRLNKVTEQYRSSTKSVAMMNTTEEGVQTEINNLREKNSKDPLLLSKSTSILENYSSEGVNNFYRERNINWKDRSKSSDLKNILSSFQTSERELNTTSRSSFHNTHEKGSDIFFREKNNDHIWNISKYEDSEKMWNLKSKNSSKRLIKSRTFKNSELESSTSLKSLQNFQNLQSISSLGNKDFLIENQCSKLRNSFESQLPIRLVIPLPLNLLKNSTISKNNSLEFMDETSSQMEISANRKVFISECTSPTSLLGNEKEEKKEDISVEMDKSKESRWKSKDEIILGTILNSDSSKLLSHDNGENLRSSKKSKSEEITRNTSELNNLDNKNEKRNISNSEGNVTTQENMFIFEDLGVFEDSLDEMSILDAELIKDHEPMFDYGSLNDNSPVIVFPKHENYQPKYANLEYKNDFRDHYAGEVSTVKLYTEENVPDFNDESWWSRENLKEIDNEFNKEALSMEHKSDPHLTQSQSNPQQKIVPENVNHSTRSSRRMFKSFLPTIYVTIALYVMAVIWFNQTSFAVQKWSNFRNYFWKLNASKTKTEV